MEFHARWDAALLSCADEVPDRLKRYLYWQQVQGLRALHQDLAEYRTYEEGDPRKSYETLRHVVDRYCIRTRQDRNRAEQTRAIARGANPALAATSKAPKVSSAKKANPGASGNAAQGSGASKGPAKVEAGGVPPTPHNVCHAFWREGKCSRANCKFEHRK